MQQTLYNCINAFMQLIYKPLVCYIDLLNWSNIGSRYIGASLINIEYSKHNILVYYISNDFQKL